MLFDTPIPTSPLTGEGAHRCRELSPIQAIPHFKDFAPLASMSASPLNLPSSILPPRACNVNLVRIYYKGITTRSSEWPLLR